MTISRIYVKTQEVLEAKTLFTTTKSELVKRNVITKLSILGLSKEQIKSLLSDNTTQD
jgi:hypothetical protein